MDALGLLSNDWLSLRDVSRLLLLSGLFTAAALLAFPRNAPTRRALLLAAVTALTVIPFLLAQSGTWTLELEQLPEFTLAQGIPNLLIVLWLSVALAIGSLQVVRVAEEHREISRLPKLKSELIDRNLRTLSDVMDIDCPEVRTGDLACSISIRKPVIVLPSYWRDWEEETLKGVLAHELVHIARRDDVWLLVMRSLTILYWWMPWLRTLESTYVRVMEESCDDAASEIIGHDVDYLSALLVAATSSSRRPRLSTAMHAHHLVSRVGRFTHRRFVELDTAGVYWCVITIVLFVGLLTSFEPALKRYEPQISDRVIYASDPASTIEVVELSYYPVVHDYVELPPGLNQHDRKRAYAPEYEPPVIYPGSAIRKRLEGDVTLQYRIGRDGGVTHATIVSSTDKTLADAAMRAVKKTRYATGYTTGRLIRTTTRTQPHIEVRRVFRFRMQSDG